MLLNLSNEVSIPDALYKIVVKENKKSPNPDVLAFMYPQVGAGYFSKHYDHKRYLTSVDEIELLTGLNFLSTLPDDIENRLEKLRAEEIWPYKK